MRQRKESAQTEPNNFPNRCSHPFGFFFGGEKGCVFQDRSYVFVVCALMFTKSEASLPIGITVYCMFAK